MQRPGMARGRRGYDGVPAPMPVNRKESPRGSAAGPLGKLPRCHVSHAVLCEYAYCDGDAGSHRHNRHDFHTNALSFVPIVIG